VTRRPAGGDPFDALGLERRQALADEDVRAAWRRVAAATHPDRADGGDPAAFTAAAAAYTLLRTAGGRGEALADLLAPGARPPAPVRAWRWRPAAAAPRLLLVAIRIRRGRPGTLAARVLAAAAVSAVAVAAAGWQPAGFAVITGAATWLVLTGRGDIAPPPD
jgi:hypothetical protein